MNKNISPLFCFLFFCLISSCSSYKKKKVSFEQDQKNTVSVEPTKEKDISIEQNGKLIKPSNGTVVLDKEEFNVVFNFPSPMTIMVNASFDDELFNLASAGEQMTTREEFLASAAMAVALFNPEKRIYLSEDASNPWYYEDEQEHNFNKVEMKGDNYRCTRSIKSIWDTAIDGSYDIENIDGPIYLVLVPTVSGENPTGEIKIDTNHLKIEWRD